MGLVSFAMGTYSNFSRGHGLPCVGIVPSSTVTYVNPQSRYRKWNYPDSPNSGIITGSRALVLSAIRGDVPGGIFGWAASGSARCRAAKRPYWDYCKPAD